MTNTFSEALLNLHRPYFAAAIRDRSIDPVQHKYGPSVLAIYRAANRIIEAGSKAVGAIPQSCMAMVTYTPRYHSWFDLTPPIAVFRFSFGWSKVLSSAVCHFVRFLFDSPSLPNSTFLHVALLIYFSNCDCPPISLHYL